MPFLGKDVPANVYFLATDVIVKIDYTVPNIVYFGSKGNVNCQPYITFFVVANGVVIELLLLMGFCQ